MTYWVDQSCTDRAEWDARIVTDAIRLVTSTYSRNERDNGDSAFQSSFKDAFNAHQDDSDDYRLSGGFWGTPSEIVEYTSGSIASLTETSNQVTSNIRIYCEYDPMVSASDPNARWKLVPDRAGDPKGPNSQRTLGVNQEWFDQINYVRRSLISLGCQTVRPGRYNLMETFGNPIKNLDGYNAPAGVPYYRSVISLCKSVFNRTTFPVVSYQDVPQNADLGQIQGGLTNFYFKWPISTVFAHELRHTKPFNLKDVAGTNSYGWQNVAQMTPENALNNAESHMYLDILAELESRHWRLATNEASWRGVLVYDPSIS